MTERSGNGEPAEGQAPEDDIPRLQTTSEREALRLPLPGATGESAGAEAAPEPPAAPVEPPSAADEVPDVAESAAQSPPGPEPEPPPPHEPASPEPATAFEPPPTISSEPASAPAAVPAGPRPELLVGAAFGGGLAVALILRWLRS